MSQREELRAALDEKAQTLLGKNLSETSLQDKYTVLGALLRDQISQLWVRTNAEYLHRGERQVYYFSIEFLLGRLLSSNLLNMGVLESWRQEMAAMGVELDRLIQQEPDAGLGNGGLGRLAACFLDSAASLHLPVHGCGIRYKYGLFEQKLVDGYQTELPDNWLKNGFVWEMRKPDKAVEVRFYGQVSLTPDDDGRLIAEHSNYWPVLAVPYDVPVVGFNNQTVNTLRLWNAEVPPDDPNSFDRINPLKALEYRYTVESITEILYPDDTHYEGRVLRLKQQYFFVSAGMQSIVRRYKKKNGSLVDFAEKIAVHINDTHPALVIPELMRILMDEEGMNWTQAWQITLNTVSYTNHTILPEALEKWPVDILRELLPRIFMIIEEINERFCRDLWRRYPGEWERIAAMAIISDGYVHMAHLAVAGSNSVNGVAKIHTEILKREVMNRFYQFYPYKFNNKTNGITHRRWLMQANPRLAKLITSAIGTSWIHHPAYLASLSRFAGDAAFGELAAAVKRANKERLAAHIRDKYGLTLDCDAIFDVQVKRIHLYKRQQLNALHILDLYNRLRENPGLDIAPRVFIFAGKAAPGYYLAKRVIKLINCLGNLINNDPAINDRLKVVYLENYSVSLGELIFPAADVSEQISTASKEASGTGNMKFMMNGAVTLGTMDGANIEIREEVGDDNIVIFGLTAEEVINYYRRGDYRPREMLADPRLKRVMEQLCSGFLPAPASEFCSLHDSLLDNDEYFVLKDFASYADAQAKIDRLFADRGCWQGMTTRNIAQSGFFSSDRTVSEYAIGIWKINPVPIGNPYWLEEG
ncbi:MAG: glycogen/starch/alpha-glucan phosphorylase [Sporomusaceae bacterium]|nr:glycogen/starch/alpha-glucan phosphorylase [Sporomusaceae bacterium]